MTTPDSLGTPKSEFLDGVRQALGRANIPPAELYPRLTDTIPAVSYTHLTLPTKA